MLSLLQGETFAMVANFLTAMPIVRSNRARALGVTSLKRSSLAPDIATIDESGLRGFELQQYYSLVAPAGTPAEIVHRLNQEMVQRLPTDDVRKRLAHEGVEAITSTPADTAKLYADEYAKWTKVIQQVGIPRQ